MPLPPDTYDVCVVGSGAAGGIAAKVLTEGGLRVVLLEAGAALNPETDFKQHMWVYEHPKRGMSKSGGDDMFPPISSFKIPGEPYTRADGTSFNWFRSRGTGGRTNHWGHTVARFDADDFAARSKDGAGDDWPIRSEDLASYYDRVEDLIGISGPSHMPPPAPRCTEVLISNACQQLNIPCVPCTASILTQPHRGRQPCHYCGQCYRGCKTASCFSSAQVLIPAALDTGRLTVVTEAMARELLLGDDGRVRAVSYIDKRSRSERQVAARAVVLAAGACESTRLLLNSRSANFPRGLANSSGVVGRNLRDSVVSRGGGFFPQLRNIPPHNHDGMGRPHVWIPWWRHDKRNEFLRGYHVLFLGGRTMPTLGMFTPVVEMTEGYGACLKKRCQELYGCYIYFIASGEMISNENSYCEIDEGVMDVWGIPVLRYHFRLGSNELKMVNDMQQTFRAIVEAAGGTYSPDIEMPSGNPGGEGFQEQGTARMGADPKTSAVNEFCQAHDVKNLFVADSSCFVSSSNKPATLTILALAWRASDYLLRELRCERL